MRRWVRVMALVAIASLALAACGRAPQTGGGTGPEVKDELGVIEIGPNEPIQIAYALVVEGPDASLGVDSRRGIEIAIDDKGGKLLGHGIQLVGENTGCNAEGGQAAANKLVSTYPKLVAIVGTSCSSEARAAIPIITQAGLSMISPSNTAPDLTAENRPPDYAGYLRTAHNDKVQGKVVAEFVYNVLGKRKAATIHDGSPYAEGLAKVFAEVFQQLGGTITNQEAVGPEDNDMRPVLTRIAANQPEVIYYPIFTKAGGFITAQSTEVAGLESVVKIGSDGLFSPDFVKAAGPAAQGMYLSSPDFTAFGPQYQDFLAKHKSKYGEDPLSAFHAHAYDAANMIFAAIEKVAVKKDDGTILIGRKALRDALFATQGFQGLTGTLSCTPTGDCGDPKIAVYQITAETVGGTWSPPTSPVKVYPQQ